MSSGTVTTVLRSRDRAPWLPGGAARGQPAAIAAIAVLTAILGGCEQDDTRDRERDTASSRKTAGGPDHRGAVIAIIAEADGVAAETLEHDVIAPIELAIEARPGVRSLRSTVRDGRGVVIVELARGREVNAALPALQSAVNGIRGILPAHLPPPSIVLGDPDVPPALWLAASCPTPRLEVSEIARDLIVPRLQRAAGVRDVVVRGAPQRAVVVRIAPARLGAFAITIADVETALEHIAGKHGGAPRELSTLGAVELAQRSGASVRLGDVATIEDGVASPPDPDHDRGPVVLGIRIATGAEPDPVIAGIRAAVAELAAALPARCTLAEAPPPAQEPVRDVRRPFAIAVAVRGPGWTTLEQLAATLERDLRASRCLVSAVASDHRASSTVQVLDPDLGRAASLGISASEIATTVRGLTIGPANLKTATRDTPIVLRIGAQDLTLSGALDQVSVRTARGELVPLSAIAAVTTRASVHLTRRNRERAITLWVDPIAWPLRDVVRRRISELTRALPAGYHATVLPDP